MGKQLKKGDLISLDIDDLAFGAKGVARYDDFVCFVERGIPGQKVKARIRKAKKRYAEAYVEEVVEPSPHQVDAPCPYFGVCGGCQLQHLAYEIQVEAKTRQIQEILERLGGFESVEVRPTIPAEKIYGYRNKMEFTFSDRRWLMAEDEGESADFALGLHVPRRYDKVIDLKACLLQSALANSVLCTVRDLVLQTGLAPYNIRTHQGYYRFLVVREGKNTDDLMLNFITSGQAGEEGDEALDWIVHKLFWKHPEVTSVLHSITDRKAQMALAEAQRLILGPEYITEKIGDLTFEISPDAFFQTNSLQAQHLFDTIVDLAEFEGNETVYDLYCGTGAIGLYIAKHVKQVLGIEVIESAVKDARRNAEINKIENIEFFLADMKDALKDPSLFGEELAVPDVVILDPPRGGTHPKTIKGLLRLGAPKIIYVSCNPAILARDLQMLCEKKYNTAAIQPVDMFPHTGHIETVVVLTKK